MTTERETTDGEPHDIVLLSGEQLAKALDPERFVCEEKNKRYEELKKWVSVSRVIGGGGGGGGGAKTPITGRAAVTIVNDQKFVASPATVTVPELPRIGALPFYGGAMLHQADMYRVFSSPLLSAGTLGRKMSMLTGAAYVVFPGEDCNAGVPDDELPLNVENFNDDEWVMTVCDEHALQRAAVVVSGDQLFVCNVRRLRLSAAYLVQHYELIIKNFESLSADVRKKVAEERIVAAVQHQKLLIARLRKLATQQTDGDLVALQCIVYQYAKPTWKEAYTSTPYAKYLDIDAPRLDDPLVRHLIAQKNQLHITAAYAVSTKDAKQYVYEFTVPFLPYEYLKTFNANFDAADKKAMEAAATPTSSVGVSKRVAPRTTTAVAVSTIAPPVTTDKQTPITDARVRPSPTVKQHVGLATPATTEAIIDKLVPTTTTTTTTAPKKTTTTTTAAVATAMDEDIADQEAGDKIDAANGLTTTDDSTIVNDLTARMEEFASKTSKDVAASNGIEVKAKSSKGAKTPRATTAKKEELGTTTNGTATIAANGVGALTTTNAAKAPTVSSATKKASAGIKRAADDDEDHDDKVAPPPAKRQSTAVAASKVAASTAKLPAQSTKTGTPLIVKRVDMNSEQWRAKCERMIGYVDQWNKETRGKKMTDDIKFGEWAIYEPSTQPTDTDAWKEIVAKEKAQAGAIWRLGNYFNKTYSHADLLRPTQAPQDDGEMYVPEGI